MAKYAEAIVGSTLSKSISASAPARGAYGRPHGRQEDAGQLDEDGLLERMEGRRDDVCRRCIQCNRYRRGPGVRQGELQQATAGGPFTKINVDLTGPHARSKNGFVSSYTY